MVNKSSCSHPGLCNSNTSSCLAVHYIRPLYQEVDLMEGKMCVHTLNEASSLNYSSVPRAPDGKNDVFGEEEENIWSIKPDVQKADIFWATCQHGY